MRSLSERKLKHSPLKDVAGILRSFQYAIYGALFTGETARPKDSKQIEGWFRPWYTYVSGMFLHAYCQTLANQRLVPDDPEVFRTLLDIMLLEKAVYELGYELKHRPDWTIIPLKGIMQLLQPKAT